MTSIDAVADLFRAAFGVEPDGVWSAPGRVNLIGEHTDYTGGFVMPLAIEQRAYVGVRPRPDRLVRAIALGQDVAEVPLDDIGPGRPDGWPAYLAGAAWVPGSSMPPGPSACGWDIALVSDVPIGAGLSSSAAITCATLLALNDLADWGADRQRLAGWAQQVENVVVGMPCGIMDQTASLRCTDGHVLFLDTRSLEIEQVPWLASHGGVALLVTDTHSPHLLVDGQYASRRRSCEEATEILGVPSLRDAALADLDAAEALTPVQKARARHVISENARVLRTRDLLLTGQAAAIGAELTASHASLRDDFEVTVPSVDAAVEAALAAGAYGARMTGGGFGGCTIALIDPADADRVAAAIDSRFAEDGFSPASHFRVVPAAGARRET